MAKVKKTFRIEEKSFDELVKLSEEWGVSQGVAVERAIRDARQMPDACQTPASTPDAAVDALSRQLDAMAGQLSVKDGQITALERALEAAQETAKAAQVLHAQERKALESVDGKKSRWQRLREAWNG